MKLTPEAYLAHRGVDIADPDALVALAESMGATVTRTRARNQTPAPEARSLGELAVPVEPVPAEEVEWVEVRLPLTTPAPGSADEAVMASASGPAASAVADAVLAVLANAMEMAEKAAEAEALSRYLGLPAP